MDIYDKSFVAGVVIAAVLAPVQIFIKPTGAEWAAWIQAVGSVAAIFFTGYFASNSERRAAKRRAVAVAAIVMSAHDKALELQVICGDPEKFLPRVRFGDMRGMMGEPLKALAAIPLHELGSYDMVVGIQETIGYLQGIEDIIAKATEAKTDIELIGRMILLANNRPKKVEDGPGYAVFIRGMGNQT